MITGKKIALFIVIFVVSAVVCASAAFLYFSQKPSVRAHAALLPDEHCRVSETYIPSWLNCYYTFTPKHTEPSTGLIVYPGGLIDSRSYAPLAHALAEQGCFVVLVSMPFNISLLGWKRAAVIQAAHPDIKQWFIGGHSLGGVAACKYARSFTDRVSGVFLFASYPSAGLSIRDTGLQCLSVYTDNDGLVPPEKIKKCTQFLPENTSYVCIKGGNHTNFADIGRNASYPGDRPARIPRHQQHMQTVSAMDRLLSKIDKND